MTITDVMIHSSLHWKWIKVIQTQFGLLFKCLTLIKRMDVRKESNLSTPYFKTLFLTFLNFPSQFSADGLWPLSALDLGSITLQLEIFLHIMHIFWSHDLDLTGCNRQISWRSDGAFGVCKKIAVAYWSHGSKKCSLTRMEKPNSSVLGQVYGKDRYSFLDGEAEAGNCLEH